MIQTIGELDNLWEKGRLCLTATESGVCPYYSHFTSEETEARKVELLTQFIQLVKQSWVLNPESLGSESLLLFIVSMILNPGCVVEPLERVLK